MADLKNIKDMTPNFHLIEHLEKCLADAKKGELLSAIIIKGWNDDSVCMGWVLDPRNSDRRLLAEMNLAWLDMSLNIGLKEGNSILAKNLDRD